MSALNSFYRNARPHWPFCILLVLFLFFTTIHIARIPNVWYDEGLNLNAARTLAETGSYGLTSGASIRLGDPAIQTGMPMLLPLAVLYRAFGPNLAVSRLLTVVCGMAALIALYLLAWRMYGALPAFVSTLLLLLMPGNSTATFIMMSRQVLGEVPAILCITLGLHLVLNPQARWWSGILTGICFGIAITLKSQILLVLVATMGLWTLYILARRRGEWRLWVSTLVVMLLVYGADSMWRSSMAGSQLATNLVTLREGIGIHILPFRALLNLKQTGVWMALGLVTVTTGGTFFLPQAVPRAAVDGEPNQVKRLQEFLLLFVSLWVIWFAFASIGWQRYYFVGVVFTLILLSNGISWLWQHFLKRTITPLVYVSGCVLCVVILSMMYIPQLVNTGAGDQFFAMVDYLHNQIPSDAKIVSMEWPVSYFTDQDYIYPPTSVINALTAAIFLNRTFDPAMFDPLRSCPAYVLVGPFTDRAIMQPALQMAQAVPLSDHGSYRLYSIPPENLVQQADGTCRAATAAP